MIISNAGFGLFGAAEELNDSQVKQIIDTNLVGPIHLIRAALPHLRAQKGGRVIQISSYGGEVASFGIGMTIVEPGGARTEFRHGSTQVAELTPTVYQTVPCHEIVGRVTKVGSAVTRFKAGAVAAVGCLVDSDRTCPQCKADSIVTAGH